MAADSRIDALRKKMEVVEDKRYSRDYLDPNRRSIANSVQVFFRDGSSTERVEVEYPLGHRRRREEGIPLLVRKFRENATSRLPEGEVNVVEKLFLDREKLEVMAVQDFMEMFVI